MLVDVPNYAEGKDIAKFSLVSDVHRLIKRRHSLTSNKRVFVFTSPAWNMRKPQFTSLF